MRELIKRWNKFGVTLEVFDLNQRIDGKWKLGYQLRINRKVIFDGNDFYNSPLHSVDSIETVKTILSFLTLKSGDTDSEYFDNYNQAQLDFIESQQCEMIRLYLADFD